MPNPRQEKYWWFSSLKSIFFNVRMTLYVHLTRISTAHQSSCSLSIQTRAVTDASTITWMQQNQASNMDVAVKTLWDKLMWGHKDLDLWLRNAKIKLVYGLIRVNVCAKYEGFVSKWSWDVAFTEMGQTDGGNKHISAPLTWLTYLT